MWYHPSYITRYPTKWEWMRQAAELNYSFIVLNLFKYKISISISNTVDVIPSNNKKTLLKSILSPITEAEIE